MNSFTHFEILQNTLILLQDREQELKNLIEKMNSEPTPSSSLIQLKTLEETVETVKRHIADVLKILSENKTIVC